MMDVLPFPLTRRFTRSLFWPSKSECRVPLGFCPPPGTHALVINGANATCLDAAGNTVDVCDGWATLPRCGSLLAVQEPWACTSSLDEARKQFERGEVLRDIRYQADNDPGDKGLSWREAVEMPFWASRFTLHVTGARVERLHDIRGKGPQREGFFPEFDERQRPIVRSDGDFAPVDYVPPNYQQIRNRFSAEAAVARAEFAAAWDEAYGADAGQRWEANPFVLVLSVEVIAAEAVDAMLHIGSTGRRRADPRIGVVRA